MDIEEIREVTNPEELFGQVCATRAAKDDAKRKWHKLARDLHPDANREPAAEAAFVTAARLYRQWERAAEAGLTSARPEITLHGRQGSYRVGEVHRKGSVATVYRAIDDSGTPVVLKMARRPSANHLLDGECTAYSALNRITAENRWLRPYYPRMLDSFVQEDPSSGVQRRVNVLTARTDGWHTLEEVAAAYPAGLDGRDWAWMHRRLLWTVAGAHLAGQTHGAILPANVLIHPAQHGVNLIGWSFATAGRTLPAMVPSEISSYPPEVRHTGTAGPAVDVYMAHTLMLRMLGPQPDPMLAGFAHGCLDRRPEDRPNAADLVLEFDRLLERLYGERVFRPFAMPAAQAAS